MECSSGVKVGKNDYIILEKSIYDLVQAARQYNKKAVEILKKIGFTWGNVQPSLFMKKNEKSIICDILHR